MRSASREAKMVGLPNKGRFDRLPMMRRLTVYRAIETRMLASRPGILSRVVTHPVVIPASAPPRHATGKVSHGDHCAWRSKTAERPAPSGNEPSMVKSGTARVRKVMYTPHPTAA